MAAKPATGEHNAQRGSRLVVVATPTAGTGGDTRALRAFSAAFSASAINNRRSLLRSSALPKMLTCRSGLIPLLLLLLVVVMPAFDGLCLHAARPKMVQRVVTANNQTWYLEHYQDNHPEHIKMGVRPDCDDGKTNVTLDMPPAETLFCPNTNIISPLRSDLRNKLECVEPPNRRDYMPDHYCMYTKLEYDHQIPVMEGHRPVWPIFGEYYHVPKQRYLHNIEHGAVVMLYHPCAQETLVSRVRSLVVRCVRKYIISREPQLDPNYPIALATWGCRYQINNVNDAHIIEFIKNTALRGPEGLYEKEGQYELALVRKAFYPPGMLSRPNEPAQGQKMNICPNEALEGHFHMYDKTHLAPVGRDHSPYAELFHDVNKATFTYENYLQLMNSYLDDKP